MQTWSALVSQGTVSRDSIGMEEACVCSASLILDVLLQSLAFDRLRTVRDSADLKNKLMGIIMILGYFGGWRGASMRTV